MHAKQLTDQVGIILLADGKVRRLAFKQTARDHRRSQANLQVGPAEVAKLFDAGLRGTALDYSLDLSIKRLFKVKQEKL